MMDLVLKTTNLTKIFAHKKAVNKVTMNIKRGDIYGFIGKNGAGKTTLIRTVVGLAAPNEGAIELFESHDLEKQRAKIGTVIEYPAVYPHFTAKQNLIVQAKLLGVKDKSILDDILQTVGLSNTGRKKAKNFSLGMKQRLAIAIALIGNPEFLILDEPINGLDPTGIKDIRDLIHKLNKEKKITILVSSHILGELSKIATCYGVIKDGELVAQFTSDEAEELLKNHVEIKVDEVEKARAVLTDELGIKDYKIIDRTIMVYDDSVIPGTINTALTKNNIVVNSIGSEGNDLESYFIKLMEGENNA